MPETTPPVYANRESKKLPIIIMWNGQNIDLGELEYLTDGSLVFKPQIPTRDSPGSVLEFGASELKDEVFFDENPDRVESSDKGFHVTLHPPKDTQPGVVHLRVSLPHLEKEKLFRREIDWFPVVKSFNVWHIDTLPLDIYPATKRPATITTAVDPNYKDSLQFKVDIYPAGSNNPEVHQDRIEVWGRWPHYQVRLNISLAKQRLPIKVRWPDDAKLEL